MSSTKLDKRAPDSQLWKSIKDSEFLDDVDEVLAMSDADLDAYLAKHGADPAKIRADGEALAKDLQARHDRLAWHGDMEKKLDRVRADAAARRTAPREKGRNNRSFAAEGMGSPALATESSKTPPATIAPTRIGFSTAP